MMTLPEKIAAAGIIAVSAGIVALVVKFAVVGLMRDLSMWEAGDDDQLARQRRGSH